MNSSPVFSRRAFLQAASSAALGTGLVGAASSGTRWVVSCRDVVLADARKSDCWESLKQLGLRGVEVAVEDDLSCRNLFHPTKHYSLATPDGIRVLQDDLAAHGVVVTAFGLFQRGSEWRIQRNVKTARQLVPAVQKMGVKVIRVDIQARKLSSEEFLPSAIKACRELCEIAKGTGIVFGVENHSANTNDPAFLERLLDGVGSSHLGVTLDANNFYWFGWPLQQVYGYYEKFAPRVVHTHCKNVRYAPSQRNTRRPMDPNYLDHSAPIYDGDIDYRRVAAILRKANYQNDLCLENECLHHFPAAQHLGVLQKEIALLKSLA